MNVESALPTPDDRSESRVAEAVETEAAALALSTGIYAAGINGLYVNLAGRESKGIVTQAESDALLDEITRGLLALRDPETGEQVVTRVDRARDVYHGAETARAPDLIVGYNRGYRGSDDSALGTVTREVIVPAPTLTSSPIVASPR